MLGAVNIDGIDIEEPIEIEHCVPVKENGASSIVPIWVIQFEIKSLAPSAALRA